MRLIYISKGNIPSKWAHTVQMMKMSEAFAEKVQKFCLLTAGGIFKAQADAVNIWEWYGIHKPFKIIKLPVYLKQGPKFAEGTFYPRFDRAAAWFCRIVRPDLVYTRSPLAGRLCVQLGIPTVMEEHLVVDGKQFQNLLAVKDEISLKGVVTITEELADTYIKAGIPSEKILVLSDAVDMARFQLKETKEKIRQRIGIPADRFIATYCGHLYPGKGTELILACAGRFPDVMFLIVGGWDKDVEQWRGKARHLSNVMFTGFIANAKVPEYLHASDILLLPYDKECSNMSWMSPLKMFEYMASGVPVIATDLPPLRKHLRHEDNALLIKENDAESFRDAIISLRLKPEMGIKLGKQARCDVEMHTWGRRAGAVIARFC